MLILLMLCNWTFWLYVIFANIDIGDNWAFTDYFMYISVFVANGNTWLLLLGVVKELHMYDDV